MRNHMPLRTFASSFVLIVSFVTAGSIAPAAAPPLDAAARQATARRVASRVAITVPAEDAELTVNGAAVPRSEEHTSELQSQSNLVCRLLLEKKKPHHRSPCPSAPSSHD